MRWVWLVVGVVGCGPVVDAGASENTSSEGTGTSATLSSSSTTTVTTSTSNTTAADETSSESSTTVLFIQAPDGGGCFTHCTRCDTWSQDCPEGESCMPWSNDGNDAWNATRCSPIPPDPALPGEPCVAVDNPYSGHSDCALGSMCWDVDPLTNEGTCVAYCPGSQANPTCLEGDECFIAYDGTIALCLPECDPLVLSCAEGRACVADRDGFACVPERLVPVVRGEACEPWIGCGDSFCAPPGAFPGCETECCTAWCDLDSPGCPDETQICVVYLGPDEKPIVPGLGYCSATR